MIEAGLLVGRHRPTHQSIVSLPRRLGVVFTVTAFKHRATALRTVQQVIYLNIELID